METLQRCLFCGFRKRTIMNRVLPITLQVFILLGVWQIFKAHNSPLQETAGEAAVARGLRFASLPSCSPGDYITLQNLKLDSILSHSRIHEISRDQNQLPVYYLTMEILVRNTEEGTLVLYPAGTQVTFDPNRVKISGFSENDANNDKNNIYDIGNMEDTGGVHMNIDKGAQKFNDLEAPAVKSDNNPAPLSQRDEDYPLDLKEGENKPRQIETDEEFDTYYSDMEEEANQDQHVVDEMLVDDQLLRIDSDKQKGQQDILDEIEDKVQKEVQSDSTQQKQMNDYKELQMGYDQVDVIGQMQVVRNDIDQNLIGQAQTAQNQMGRNPMGQPQMNLSATDHNQIYKPHMGQGQTGQGEVGEGELGELRKQNLETQLDGPYRSAVGTEKQAGQKFDSSLFQGDQFPEGLLKNPILSKGNPMPSQNMQQINMGQGILRQENSLPLGNKTENGPSQSDQFQENFPKNPPEQLPGGHPILSQNNQQNNMAQGILRRQDSLPLGNKTTENQGDKSGYQSQNIGQQQAQISENAFPGEFSREDGSLLYAEGLAERVKKFKSELFGKKHDASNIQGLKTSEVFHLINPKACEGVEHIDVAYVINSQPQNDEQRQRIRNTIVESVFFKSFTIVYVFVVGETTSPNFQSNLIREHDKYGDIAQGEFLDAPENGIHKGIWGMSWVKQVCPQVKFIMKIDDDVFVDTEKLIRGLIPAANKVIVDDDRAMFCLFNPEGPVPRAGSNAFRADQFPERTILRPYCKGFAILMTQSASSSLFAASELVPLFENLDDLYLYGILPFVVGDVKVYDLGNKRAFQESGSDMLECYKTKIDKCQYVAAKVTGGQFTSLWNFLMVRGHGVHKGWTDSSSLWDMSSFLRKF